MSTTNNQADAMPQNFVAGQYESSSHDGEFSIFDSTMAEEYVLRSSGQGYDTEIEEYNLSSNPVNESFTPISVDGGVDSNGGLRSSRIPEEALVDVRMTVNLYEYEEPEPRITNPARYLSHLEVIPIGDLPADSRVCLICYQDYHTGSPNEDAVKTTPCGHTFGKSCLQNWLAISTTCPLCRQTLCESDIPNRGIQVSVNNYEWHTARFLTTVEAIDRRAEILETPASIEEDEDSVSIMFESEERYFVYSVEVLELFSTFLRVWNGSQGTRLDATRVATALAAQMGRLYLYLRRKYPYDHVHAGWGEHGPPVSFLLDPAATELIEISLNHLAEHYEA